MGQEAMDDASRRAYEAARRAFEDAPEVKAHAWRGTLEKRAASKGALGAEALGEAAVAATSASGLSAVSEGKSAFGSSSEPWPPAPSDRGVSSACAVRPENEDDDGYDPWSDRQPVDSFWEEDPWR